MYIQILSDIAIIKASALIEGIYKKKYIKSKLSLKVSQIT